MKESIKNLREKHNYSQSYLATYLEVSRQMYIKYESGEVEPPVHIVVKLAKLYKVSYDRVKAVEGLVEEQIICSG